LYAAVVPNRALKWHWVSANVSTRVVAQLARALTARRYGVMIRSR